MTAAYTSGVSAGTSRDPLSVKWMPNIPYETITVGPDGDYTSLETLCAALVARSEGDWYTLADTTGKTATVIQTGLTAILSDAVLIQSGAIKPGDIFSANSGSDWYLIISITGSTLTLNTPYRTANVFGGAFQIARPKWTRVVLTQGNHDRIEFGTGPVFVGIVGNNSTLTKVVSPDYKIRMPSQGVLSIRDLVGTDGIMVFPTPGGGKTYATSALVHENVTFKTAAVDAIGPSYGGNVYLQGGDYSATQDILLPNLTTLGPFIISDCRVDGVCDANPIRLLIRMFWGNSKITAHDSVFTITHVGGQPISGNSMFVEMSSNGSHTFNDCIFNYVSDDETRCNLGGMYSGVATSCEFILNRCTVLVNGAAPTAAFNLIAPLTYTGTGRLTCNQCSLGSASDGGGGTFVVTINP